jgi:hypothetical protein
MWNLKCTIIPVIIGATGIVIYCKMFDDFGVGFWIGIS